MNAPIPFPYRRLVVVGTTGFGKSTLAERLSRRLGLDFIELDALHWEPNWQPAADAVFRRRVDAATRAPAWAVAGNYSRVRDVVWPRAQALIWLDYPFLLGLRRLVARTVRRSVRREILWNGNRERLWWHLKVWSDESLLTWYFKSHGRRKREYPRLLSLPEYAHLRVFRFATPAETDSWVEKLPELERNADG